MARPEGGAEVKDPEDRWAGKPQWMKDMQTRLDQGEEPEGEFSREDRER